MDGEGIIQPPTDEACKNGAQGNHAIGDGLALGGVLRSNHQADILHHGRNYQRKGKSLQQIGSIQQGHAAGHGNCKGFGNEGQGRKAQYGGAAKVLGKPGVKQHHRNLQHGLEGADAAKITGVASHTAQNVD